MRENNFEMLAKCLYGFEDVLEKELRELGGMDIKKGHRSVSFVGDLGFMYKANLMLRSAIALLVPFQEFQAKDEEALYQGIKRIRWEDHIASDGTIAISSSVHSDHFSHSKYVVYKVKDAIVDRMREKFGKRPSIELKNPDLQIDIHINKDICHVSFNSSGDPLFKRGYRQQTGIAPLNEVLAASCLLQSDWHGQSRFLDPMCGSGTFLIEAAMIACNIAPNLNREQFNFMNWPDWDADLFEVIQKSVLKKMKDFHFHIKGYDIDPRSVENARTNIKSANLEDFISVEEQDFFSSEKDGDFHLHLVSNPPYGERMPIPAEHFYQKIGDQLKTHYTDTDAWLLMADQEAIKSIGLRTDSKTKVYNGAIEARLNHYSIYAGSKKRRKRS
jgi:putative N6-adenine-specific DNA methylase